MPIKRRLNIRGQLKPSNDGNLGTRESDGGLDKRTISIRHQQVPTALAATPLNELVGYARVKYAYADGIQARARTAQRRLPPSGKALMNLIYGNATFRVYDAPEYDRKIIGEGKALIIEHEEMNKFDRQGHWRLKIHANSLTFAPKKQ